LKIRSKFSFWIIVLVSLFIGLTGLIVFFAQWIVRNPQEYNRDMIIADIWMSVVWSWLFFGELRTKAVKLQIVNGEIIVSSFLGLGPKKTYLLNEFDGFNTWVNSGSPEYEYLYLIKNRKKKIRLSQQYYKNYVELKNAIRKQVPYQEGGGGHWLLDILSIFNIFR